MDKQEHINDLSKKLRAYAHDLQLIDKGDCENLADFIVTTLNYRKVPDGAVVLLIGENNQAIDEKTIEYFVKHNEQIRKEAVIEFAEKLKKRTILYSGINVKYEAITADIIDELLKEYEK